MWRACTRGAPGFKRTVVQNQSCLYRRDSCGIHVSAETSLQWTDKISSRIFTQTILLIFSPVLYWLSSYLKEFRSIVTSNSPGWHDSISRSKHVHDKPEKFTWRAMIEPVDVCVCGYVCVCVCVWVCECVRVHALEHLCIAYMVLITTTVVCKSTWQCQYVGCITFEPKRHCTLVQMCILLVWSG